MARHNTRIPVPAAPEFQVGRVIAYYRERLELIDRLIEEITAMTGAAKPEEASCDSAADS